MQRRQQLATDHRHSVTDRLISLHPTCLVSPSESETMDALASGVALILAPRLADDPGHERRARVQALVRLGRVDNRFIYAPVVIKNNEVFETASSRRMHEGSLASLSPNDVTVIEGIGPRGTPAVTRNGLALAHATRLLQSLGHGDDAGRVAMIDRNARVWWFDLASTNFPRINLSTYDEHYATRRSVLDAHDRWRRSEGDFPTTPYWHRDCPDCPYRATCEAALDRVDDVSLTRFTTRDQQHLLRAAGVTTRRDLAGLNPELARQARQRGATPDEPRELHLARGIERLDDLIYRARVHTAGTLLRSVAAHEVGCPSADVEVDVDMESYEDRTYLWGATVRLRSPLDGVSQGYVSFVEWGELTDEAEARVFAEFWRWFATLRNTAHAAGRTFAAYCFWAQAEDGAMNRAVQFGGGAGPTRAELDDFRGGTPKEWFDLHEQVKRQIQTDGPLGLKRLARAAGFDWRDENPSGEASMLWYEVARGSDGEATASRQRILDYNEDDCRATLALRDWLNGPARQLAHRDEPVVPGLPT